MILGRIRTSAVTGGPDNPPTLALVRELQELDRAGVEWDGPDVRYLFTVEGAVYKPEWEGVKVHRFNRVDGVLELDVAVSWERLMSEPPHDVVMTALRDSIPLIDAYLTKRRIAHLSEGLAEVISRYGTAVSDRRT